MRSDDDKIGLGFLGGSQNLGIDAGAMRDENIGFKVGGIGTSDQGGNPVLQIRDDDLVGDRRRPCLQNGLDVAHDGEDMKPAPKVRASSTAESNGLRQEVSSLRSMASRMFLYMCEPRTERRQNDFAVFQVVAPAVSRHNHPYHSSSSRGLHDRRIPSAERCDRGSRHRHRHEG